VAPAQDDKSTSDGTPIDQFRQLVGAGSLYASATFSETDVEFIALVIGNIGLQIDLYCPRCMATSTFQLPAVKTDGLNVFDPYNPAAPTGVITRDPVPISKISHLKHIARALELRCARNSVHRVEFILRVTDNIVSPGSPTGRGHGSGSLSTPQPAKHSYTFIKIGQYPQHAELVAGRLKAVSKIAEPLDMKELRRAVGLMSHDVAIGAFVYLRRVFERIIARAWHSAVEAGEPLPDVIRMDEKIAALKNYLPDLIVKNAKVYGILSLGLHELTEETCASAYPVVEESIIAMLEDAHAHIEKQKRDKALAADLAKLSGELGKKS
jgi:hypothetical protein